MGLCLVGLDKALHRYEAASERSWPKRLIRGAALREAERWIVARQEADGSWGGIQPPMVYSTIALVLRGYPLDHPVVKAALLGLERFTLDDEKGRRIEACQSPIWDTALSVIALADAGAADDPCVEAAVEWLLDREVTVVGDWAVRRPALAPGGWSFEFENVNYPDIDDTAEVVLALRRAFGEAGAVTLPARRPWTGWSVCGRTTADGARSTPTTTRDCPPSCRSSTLAPSPTHPPWTLLPMWSRCWRARTGRSSRRGRRP